MTEGTRRGLAFAISVVTLPLVILMILGLFIPVLGWATSLTSMIIIGCLQATRRNLLRGIPE